MLAGEEVKDLSAELGIHNVTLYKWRCQALIDAGSCPGTKSFGARTCTQTAEWERFPHDGGNDSRSTTGARSPDGLRPSSRAPGGGTDRSPPVL
jgi:hypothetical protein